MRPDERRRLLQQLLKTGDARLRQALWRLLRDRQLQQRVSALAQLLDRSLTQMLESGSSDVFNRQLRDLKLLRRLLLDERVPRWQKAIPVAAALYLISPLDLIPDFLPALGQMDDLAVLLGSLRLFRSLVPPALIEEHLAAIDGELVDAPGWRSADFVAGTGTQRAGTGTQRAPTERGQAGTGSGSLDAS